MTNSLGCMDGLATAGGQADTPAGSSSPSHNALLLKKSTPMPKPQVCDGRPSLDHKQLLLCQLWVSWCNACIVEMCSTCRLLSKAAAWASNTAGLEHVSWSDQAFHVKISAGPACAQKLQDKQCSVLQLTCTQFFQKGTQAQRGADVASWCTGRGESQLQG